MPIQTTTDLGHVPVSLTRASESEHRMWILRASTPGITRRSTFRIPLGRHKTVGRSTVADFIFDVPMVSRVHCRLSATEPGTLKIEDLDSTNGTFVNGRRVERANLGCGDQVRIGRLDLVVDSAD
jgi:pSer/pThr/pTyr-binding forkhead associated (FHA) protein